jgi:hypothetical protein
MSAPTTFLADEVETLFQQLAESNGDWANGAALYGAGGLFDASRKARLSLIAAEIRDDYTEKKEKVTEAQITELSHAHPDYQKFISTSTIDRARWLLCDAERTCAMLRLKSLTYNPVR